MLRKSKAYRISILALFIAIIMVQNFVPLFGYIPVGPLSLTTIHITVIIAAVMLGPLDGGIVGGVWGLLSFIRAFTAPTSPVEPLIFTNPLISILPRILIGVVAGYVFIALTKTKIKPVLSLVITAVVGSLTNALLVLGMIAIFYRTPAVAHAYGVSDPSLITKVLMATVGTNSIPETILAAIVVPLICLPLLKHRQAKTK
ncbi:ECF transporter S component [Fructilactobacillus lindneri]|uniref:Integral membrane protein n=2 Tax=Fructilactobacillus lindneri TaxID=53444 RepID=A0A0R2JSH1_9LACO|nr:ECF transporter S component [Fructilactobacillus lindneri]ANZ57413.1 hypothetical protein AYR60_00740 [Fructilactobacillus lindneri]ANZ58680.1 hypothetical protein AYR59_00740 [Fructilactobacillus lindneri]KRN80024.1 hypothetical protein IV52_GL000141 [Fructilactobacillus lindneri DSM 20690 = JCM 11027]POG97898.1 ECF transporter S component [Fructilactobacillus lindneri]POG99230.1 ECF transporter S component [Fructilactobacillus lindneri]